MHPLLLEGRDVSLDSAMDAECWAFWRVLGRSDARLGRRLEGHLRVHVLLVTQAVDQLFRTLAGALLHPHTSLSLHVSKQGDGPVAKRLRRTLGSKAVLSVLQRAYGKLTLPCAWVFSRDCRKSHVQAVNHPFIALAVHDSMLAALAGRLVEWSRSFLLAACSPSELRKLRAAPPIPALQAVLRGWHWIRDQGLPLRLAHLGFLLLGWSLLRDLQPQREGCALQKAHELISWRQIGNWVMRRHSLAEELNEQFADDTETPTDVELNFLCSEGLMLRKRVGEHDESTYVVPGKAPDEVVDVRLEREPAGLYAQHSSHTQQTPHRGRSTEQVGAASARSSYCLLGRQGLCCAH